MSELFEESRGGDKNRASARKEEWHAFLILSVLLAPILAVAIVGGYGFVVWMGQLLWRGAGS